MKKAESVIIKEGIVAKVNKFRGTAEVVTVTSAEQVIADCLTAFKVMDSRVSVYSDGIEIEPFNEEPISLTDCQGTDTEFTGNENSYISVNEQPPIKYTLKNGNLTFQGSSFTDFIEVYDEATITMDVYYGFACMNIKPVGTYIQ